MQIKSRYLKRTFLDTVLIREKNRGITCALAIFLRSIDLFSSDNLDVRAIVNVIFINKTISTVKVPTRFRSSTFELTVVYFPLWRLLHYFGHMG